MAVYSRVILSGSTNGRGIPVTGVTSSSANLLHTAVTGANDFHEVYIYAVNTQTSDSDVWVRFGVTTAQSVTAGVTVTEIRVRITQAGGPVLIVPGWPLNGGNIVEAYATAVNRVVIYGYANTRIS